MDWAFYGWSALLVAIAAVCGALLYLVEDWRERRRDQ
jgi:asparagine N-glycosylation enzyme membrane subunit Stt3